MAAKGVRDYDWHQQDVSAASHYEGRALERLPLAYRADGLQEGHHTLHHREGDPTAVAVQGPQDQS